MQAKTYKLVFLRTKKNFYRAKVFGGKVKQISEYVESTYGEKRIMRWQPITQNKLFNKVKGMFKNE